MFIAMLLNLKRVAPWVKKRESKKIRKTQNKQRKRNRKNKVER